MCIGVYAGEWVILSCAMRNRVDKRWSDGHDLGPPVGAGASKQKSWEGQRAAPVAERFVHHCGEDVDVLGRHGLICRWSEGRHQRHTALNEIRCLLHVCQPDLSHLGCSAAMASDQTVFRWCHGSLGSFYTT